MHFLKGVEKAAAGRAMLVVDVPGHEFSVLQGLGHGLELFSLCKCEVSRVPMYAGGAMFKDIDAHMQAYGFRLAPHRYVQVPRHGDVLFVRDQVPVTPVGLPSRVVALRSIQ